MKFGRFLTLALACIAATPSPARVIRAKEVDWQVIRNAEPPGLGLRVELPKTTFYQGEIIPATLVFTNTGPLREIWTGTSDRSGRLPDMVFIATDEAGQRVADPLEWYRLRTFFSGGGADYAPLGEWRITLVANEWLRFDRPGRYTLFAASARPYETAGITKLVSDPVAITIAPLSQEDERRITTTAAREVELHDQWAQEAITTLRHLGTPASRAALLRLVAEPGSFDALAAFYTAPDPEEAAKVVLRAVRRGKLPLNQSVEDLYTTLKTASFYRSPWPTDPEAAKRHGEKLAAAYAAAKQEITRAGKPF